MNKQETRFRSDIQILRSLAVISVILFHTGLSFIQSGFLGVDVFFVISGYLIINIIFREFDNTGKFSLIGFWSRRARRLIPASSLVIISTLVTSWYFLTPQSAKRVSIDSIFSALFSANIRFGMVELDYWASSNSSPFLHFWSLGVEEQFYFLWPIFLAVAVRPLSRKLKGARSLLLLAVTFLSLILNIYLMNQDSPWDFYSPFSRAWEFGIGGLAAAISSKYTKKSSQPVTNARTNSYLRLTLFVALVGLMMMNRQDSYWGIFQILSAVLLTAILLRLGESTDGDLFEKIFSKRRALVYMGDISYSLYLWHWPVIYFFGLFLSDTKNRGLPENVKYIFFAYILIFLLSALTYKFIENPIRHLPSLVSSSKKTFSFALMSIIFVIGLALFLPRTALSNFDAGEVKVANDVDETYINANSLEWEKSISALALQTQPTDSLMQVPNEVSKASESIPKTYADGCHVGGKVTVPPSGCTYGDTTSEHVVAIFGDSHANQYFPALEIAARSQKSALLARTRSNCTYADVVVFRDAKPDKACNEWRQNVINELINTKPDVVFVSSRLNLNVSKKDGTSRPDPNSSRQVLIDGLGSTILQLENAGITVVLIRDTPGMDRNVPDCLSGHLPTKCVTPLVKNLTSIQYSGGVTSAFKNARVLDLTLALCNIQTCDPVRGGKIVWRDSHHLTADFAATLSPIFGKVLKEVSSTN